MRRLYVQPVRLSFQFLESSISDRLVKPQQEIILQESWYEKLNRWDEALRAYESKREEYPPGTMPHLEATMGRLR